MKKAMLFAATLLAAVSVFADPPDKKFTLGLNAGWGLYCGGDYNTVMDGYDDYLDYYYSGRAGSYKKLSTGFGAGLEGIYWFKPNMGIGLGLGWYQSSYSDNPIDFQDGPYSNRYVISTSVNVVPVELNFHYRMKLCEESMLEFFFGPGLYFGCFDFLKDYEYGWGNQSGTFEFKGQTTALGLQGGVGVTYPIVKDKLWFFGSLEGRTTSLKKFADEWTDKGTFLGTPYDYSGTGGQFWVYDVKPGQQTYPVFNFNETKPSGEGIKNVREGSVGGGDLHLRVGVRYGF